VFDGFDAVPKLPQKKCFDFQIESFVIWNQGDARAELIHQLCGGASCSQIALSQEFNKEGVRDRTDDSTLAHLAAKGIKKGGS
jgi:hypothetical protein